MKLSLLLAVLPLAVQAMRAPSFESPAARLEEAIQKLQQRIRGPVARFRCPLPVACKINGFSIF